MDYNTRHISPELLFTWIEEELAQGRKTRFMVTGVSMTPWIINKRDSVELVSTRDLELRKGDIILFKPFSGRYILHRITRVMPDGYITTGDGNLWRDPPIPKECVIGKVTRIYRKERIIDCDVWYWKLIAAFWMGLFPIRKQMLGCIAFCSDKKKRLHR